MIIFVASEIHNFDFQQTNKAQAAKGCKYPVFPNHGYGISDGDRLFPNLQILFKMSEKDKLGRRPKEIVKTITENGSVASHRLNLSEMLIAWLRVNEEATDEKKEDVYFTFFILNETLKDVQSLQERRGE